MTHANRQTYLVFISIMLFVLLAVSALSRMNLIDDSSDHVLLPRQAAVKPMSDAIPDGVNISHVVVKFNDEAQVRQRGDRFISLSGRSISEADRVLSSYMSSQLRRLFAIADEATLDQRKSSLESKQGSSWLI